MEEVVILSTVFNGILLTSFKLQTHLIESTLPPIYKNH